jgi:hypothetical protein
MALTFLCKLLNGAQVLDDHCTCTFSKLSRESMLGGKFDGEGSISILAMWPFELRGKEPRQFTLRFEGVVVEHVGKVEEVPIVLVPDDLVGSRTAAFRIGTV